MTASARLKEKEKRVEKAVKTDKARHGPSHTLLGEDRLPGERSESSKSRKRTKAERSEELRKRECERLKNRRKNFTEEEREKERQRDRERRKNATTEQKEKEKERMRRRRQNRTPEQILRDNEKLRLGRIRRKYGGLEMGDTQATEMEMESGEKAEPGIEQIQQEGGTDGRGTENDEPGQKQPHAKGEGGLVMTQESDRNIGEEIEVANV
jgi:hypothetical protein